MPWNPEHYHRISKDKFVDDPEIKQDESSFRLKFLQAIDMDSCPTCIHVSKVILYALAIYGFISLFF